MAAASNRIAIALALAFAIATHGASALAQPERADKLYEEGQALLRAGNFAAACVKLEESYRLDAALGTLLNMAFCHERQGRVGLAWREYRAAAAQATKDNQLPRAKFATSRASELEPRLVGLRVVAPRGAELRALRVDGDPVEGDLAIVFVEPGRRVVDATTADGTRPIIVDIRAGEGEVRVEVPAIAHLTTPASPPAPPPAPAAAAHERVVDGAPVTTSDSGATKRVVGWSLAGVGAVGLGLGTYFGLQTFSEKSAAEAGCDGDLCNAEGKRHGDKAHAFALVSTLLFAVGVGAAGAGAYLIVTSNGAAVGGSF